MKSSLAGIAALAISLPLSVAFNNPAGVGIWCGKAYESRYDGNSSPSDC